MCLFFPSPLIFVPPYFHENMHDIRPPRLFLGLRLRPCFKWTILTFPARYMDRTLDGEKAEGLGDCIVPRRGLEADCAA